MLVCKYYQNVVTKIKEGFNFIDGKFSKFKNLICPHVGWNNIELVKKIDLFKGLDNNSYFYFSPFIPFKKLRSK